MWKIARVKSRRSWMGFDGTNCTFWSKTKSRKLARENSEQEWKERIFKLDDIGYGTATGFKGVNCRHDWYPYYKGSARTYTQEQLDAWENEKVTYNGKEYSKYDATQLQRAMERRIRADKKELAGLQGILTSTKDNKLIEDTKTNLVDAH